jgi:3-phosphoshikimate 1-carboxyvinyltransferase
LAIDEFPAIMVAAATASGRTVLQGARELRVKESDRIIAITEGFKAIGVSCIAREDGMEVNGGRIIGGTVNSFTDHRIAMAFAMAGLVAIRPITILDCANVNTSFPGFVELAQQAGLHIERQDGGDV